MEPMTWGFIGTLAGTIIGASVSIFTTIIAASNSRKLQKEAASFERLERAREFQRNNLIEFQDALSSGMRLIARAHIEDIESFRKNKNSSRSELLSEELNEDIRRSTRKLVILTERIANDLLREDIKKLRGEMSLVLIANNENESTATMHKAAITFEKTMVTLGTVLRESY